MFLTWGSEEIVSALISLAVGFIFYVFLPKKKAKEFILSEYERTGNKKSKLQSLLIVLLFLI